MPFCFSAHEWSAPAVMATGVFKHDDRHKNTAICARVTDCDGENFPGEVPEVIPSPTSQITASAKYEFEGTSENPFGPFGSGEPATRHKNTAICARVTDCDGENFPGEVPEVIPSPTSHVTASA